MSKFYNVYRMQLEPEESKPEQVAERESFLKAHGHMLNDECGLYDVVADVVPFYPEKMCARDLFNSEHELIGCDRVIIGERLSTGIVEDYINDTKVIYLIEEVD